ncbi:hypothetical protein ACP4OV_020686 [Aristida adscensionis]
MAPAPAPAMDGADEGGGGARNQSNLVVVKSEDLSTGDLMDGAAVEDPCSMPAAGDQVAGAPDPAVEDPQLVKDEGGDTTECSSSFGDTCSGFDDEADGGEPEVNSHFPDLVHGGEALRSPRKKKVTLEWRTAIRPIQWRCQWLELRMKELSSQVSKYDRELALIEKEKELQQAASKPNGSVPESMQICKGHRNSYMKRRTRKTHEDTVDTSLYIKKHQILSYYYDKQNKGAGNDGLLIDDDCSSPVKRGVTGQRDTVTMFDAEEYDMIIEQLTLMNILETIDGAQSQVHLLQDRLGKAHLEDQETSGFSENTTQVRVARKRQSTQKHSFSYKTHRYTKPQKRKNLNILLKDDDGPALAVRPALPDKETNHCVAKGDVGEGEEWNQSGDRTITADLLLGVDNSLPIGHMGNSNSFNEDMDDILIDNKAAATEGCQQFEKVKHLPSETSPLGQDTSAPAEVENTSVPVKIENTSAPVVKQETLPEKTAMEKQGQKPKKKKGKRSVSVTKKHRRESSILPASKQTTESTSSGALGMETMTTRSAGKKRKCGNKSTVAKKRKSGNSSLAAKKQETEESTSAAKKRKTEESTSAANAETENSSAAAKKQESESAPSKLKVEKAVLVAVNSRRSQRVRKPKVY